MALAALAAFAGAAVQSASGMGFALVLSPALFAVMEPEEAVTAVLLLGAALCVLVLIESRRVATYGLGRLLLPAVPGLPVGVAVLVVLSKESLQPFPVVLAGKDVQGHTSPRHRDVESGRAGIVEHLWEIANDDVLRLQALRVPWARHGEATTRRRGRTV